MPSLRERDLYNMGNALAEMGDTKGAIDAYRKALVLEPRDEAARHNLEVLLRKLPPPKSRDRRRRLRTAAGRTAGHRMAARTVAGATGAATAGRATVGRVTVGSAATGTPRGDGGSRAGMRAGRWRRRREPRARRSGGGRGWRDGRRPEARQRPTPASRNRRQLRDGGVGEWVAIRPE